MLIATNNLKNKYLLSKVHKTPQPRNETSPRCFLTKEKKRVYTVKLPQGIKDPTVESCDQDSTANISRNFSMSGKYTFGMSRQPLLHL